MNKKIIFTIYLQKDLGEGFEACLKKTGLKPNTYINELIRQDLNDRGIL